MGGKVRMFKKIELLNSMPYDAIWLFMRPLIHPDASTITLSGVLHALSDPIRLTIVRRLRDCPDQACNAAMPCPDMPKSTLSNHFRILREAGIICSRREGTQHANTLRRDDLEARFPGLLDAILKAAETP